MKKILVMLLVVALAVTVAIPAATDAARPLEPAVLLTAATAASEELQVTDAVRSFLVLSEYIPVAVNCLVEPSGMLGLAGATSRETRAAGATATLPVPQPAVKKSNRTPHIRRKNAFKAVNGKAIINVNNFPILMCSSLCIRTNCQNLSF